MGGEVDREGEEAGPEGREVDPVWASPEGRGPYGKACEAWEAEVPCWDAERGCAAAEGGCCGKVCCSKDRHGPF